MSDLSAPPFSTWRFNRSEVAGALGDLGLFLPIAIGLVLMNGLDAGCIFASAGLLYLLTGIYFGVITPVQPMKLIGAYAIATGMVPIRISAAGMWIGLLLLLLALSNGAGLIGRIIPKSTIRGVQLATGILLLSQGVKLILGTSDLQRLKGIAEPFLALAGIGPLPIGLVLGLISVAMILLLLQNTVAPAGIAVILFGAFTGLILKAPGHFDGFTLGFALPGPLPFGLPGTSDLAVALTALALPQLPLTLGNSVYAHVDLARGYFGADRARRVTPRGLCASMGLANAAIALFGGMPLCHGAGGLAAHHRFGARTFTSNLIIGVLFLLVGLVVGKGAVALMTLIPLSVLGSLLVFAGAELALAIRDTRERRDLFVAIVIVGVALAANMAAGFAVGVLLANVLKWNKLKI